MIRIMNNADSKRDDRTRQSLRLAPDLWLAIDKARLRRAGSISRNTWIAEAILEKVERDTLVDLKAHRRGDDAKFL
jgi:hypothetical protein